MVVHWWIFAKTRFGGARIELVGGGGVGLLETGGSANSETRLGIWRKRRERAVLIDGWDVRDDPWMNVYTSTESVGHGLFVLGKAHLERPFVCRKKSV
jgi:hypothetical protein